MKRNFRAFFSSPLLPFLFSYYASFSKGREKIKKVSNRHTKNAWCSVSSRAWEMGKQWNSLFSQKMVYMLSAHLSYYATCHYNRVNSIDIIFTLLSFNRVNSIDLSNYALCHYNRVLSIDIIYTQLSFNRVNSIDLSSYATWHYNRVHSIDVRYT